MKWLGFLRRRRHAWQTPRGFYTPFALQGDPALDGDGRREELYSRLFSTADGRAVLADILALSGVGRPAYEPGTAREDAIFFDGMKANALSIARLAGLETGALGRALVTGKLEAMTHEDDEPDHGDD